MAPDKIYVTTYSVNSAYGTKWGCWTERECAGHAYIRKDALIDILNEEKDKTIIGICEYDTGLENGRMEVIETLLQKIKAL